MERLIVVNRRIVCLLVIATMLMSGCRSGKNLGLPPEELSRISRAAGFLAAKVEESDGFIAGENHGGKESNYAYLYDNAVAAIALSCSGADIAAQKIADAMVFAQEHDRYFQDGRLRNAYVSGNPKSDSGRSIAFGKVTVRLPGFWRDGEWQEDSYAVSTSSGSMAWAILALCRVAEHAAEAQRKAYLLSAMRAADFTLKLHSGSQGFTAGFEGWDDAQAKVSSKSTEHNMVLACAFSLLSHTIEKTNPDKAAEYSRAAGEARTFALSMFDKEQGCFYAGTEADGKKISKTVIPINVNSLALLALEEDLEDKDSILSFIEMHMAVGKGFDFSDGDLDGIWNEGTAQMAVCYHMRGLDDNYSSLMDYLKTQEEKDGSIPAADRNGVSTGFVSAGSDELWEYNNVRSIAATAWLAFAQLQQNPFESPLK